MVTKFFVKYLHISFPSNHKGFHYEALQPLLKTPDQCGKLNIDSEIFI
jgi:hypothetical protein